ncbi:MAG: hypothetical protein Q7R30_12230 [Acidobacteriota bacterium]|nr:hypothetical protein [Acidobacteriota bacterium]
MIPFLLAAALAASQQPGVPATIPEMWGAWCARCHADDGSGKVNEPTVTVVPMDFTDCRVTTPEPDADWERAIAKGGPAVGLSSEMPGFEDSLSPEQITGFVTHMRGFCKESGWPMGNLNFPRPIITEKAFPENEFLILPAISHKTEPGAPALTEISLVGLYERRIGKRAMYEIAVPLATTDFGGSRRGGLGDIAAAFNYTTYASETSARIVSVGLEAVIPSGSQDKGTGHGTVIFEPFVTAGAMLRDWYVQAQAKVELPVDLVKAGRAYIYNLYLGRDTSAAPNTWTFGVELNGENRELAVTPQVRKGLTRTGALAGSLGVMIPLNEREAQGVRWVGYLLWEYLEPVRARP